MTFRTRLLLAFALAALVPLGVLALGVRLEMGARMGEQADRRVQSLVEVLRADLAAESRATRTRLRALGRELAADNRFRLAVLGTGSIEETDAERRWLLDWAGEAMRSGDLAVLQLQDDAGRILSSGHFRNEYDRRAPELPAALARAIAARAAPGALLSVRTARGPLTALAGVDSLEVAGRRFTLVGGRAMDSAAVARLAPAAELRVALATAEDTAPRLPGDLVARIPLVHVDALDGVAVDTARLVVTHDGGALRELQRSLDRWVALALGATLLLALGLGAWLAARVSRPLAELADKTARVDLDRLDQEFAARDGGEGARDDEIGALARLLDAMTGRLRASAARLREAERRAAVGDVARQVNHDVKNGLAPIRHVLRHLTQVAEQEPARLAAIYQERRGTLESSVAYLEDLARNYARLSPALDRAACDPNAALREVARTVQREGAEIETRLAEPVPAVRADPVVLRRILENLAGNAVDSLGGRPGRVTLASEATTGGVRLTVADTGRGMTRAELDRAFDDFHTTKEGGTGLGLSVVRRLVMDLGGTLRVETEPGQGSRFTVEIPTA